MLAAMIWQQQYTQKSYWQYYVGIQYIVQIIQRTENKQEQNKMLVRYSQTKNVEMYHVFRCGINGQILS